MGFKVTSGHNMQDSKQIWFILLLCAILCTVSGALLTVSAPHSYILLMRMALSCPVSIVGTALTVYVPFLVSVYLIIHSKPWLVNLICGIYLFLFSAAGCAIASAFGTAAWLIRLMAQFPDLCLIPALILLSLFKFKGKCSKYTAVWFSIFALVTGMIDYCLISPFLANLIDTYETTGRYAIHVGLDWCL